MKPRIEAYIADWGFHQDLTKEQADCLTHVNYSFGHVVDGRVSIDHLEQRPRLEKLQKDFPHLKVNLSVGGWGADGFSQAVATAEGRELLASTAISVIREMDLTGIDWDWEYPASDEAGIACQPADIQNMSDFLVLMRQKLSALTQETGRYYEQSIAVGANHTEDYICPQVLPVLDTVNLMTYDLHMPGMTSHMTGLRANPGAAFSVEESVAAFHAAGVPKEKMLLGAAFYFHVFEGSQLPEPFAKPYQSKGGHFPFHALTPDWERRWDEKAQAAYYVKGDTVLSGDEEQSLMLKYRYILDEGLAGAILWELNHDPRNVLLPHLAGKA